MDAKEHMLRQAAKLLKAADEHGWKVDVAWKGQPPTERLDATATRGQETITIWWEDGRLLEAPLYDLAGRTTKLRNTSACAQQMGLKPNFDLVARRKKRAIMVSGDDVINIEPDPESLPWKWMENPTDSDILKACYCKEIVWLNGLTGLVETDRVVRSSDPDKYKGNYNKQLYRIHRSSAGREILMFLGVFGFRAVAFDQILRVG